MFNCLTAIWKRCDVKKLWVKKPQHYYCCSWFFLRWLMLTEAALAGDKDGRVVRNSSRTVQYLHLNITVRLHTKKNTRVGKHNKQAVKIRHIQPNQPTNKWIIALFFLLLFLSTYWRLAAMTTTATEIRVCVFLSVFANSFCQTLNCMTWCASVRVTAAHYLRSTFCSVVPHCLLVDAVLSWGFSGHRPAVLSRSATKQTADTRSPEKTHKAGVKTMRQLHQYFILHPFQHRVATHVILLHPVVFFLALAKVTFDLFDHFQFKLFGWNGK